MSAKVTWRDTGWSDVRNRIRLATKSRVRVGVLEPDASRTHPLRNTLTVGAVATMQEYGSSRAGIPERSFLRVTANTNHALVRDGLIGACRAAIQGGGFMAAMHKLGEEFRLRVVERILSGSIPPPLAPYTIAKKGHSETLQDTMTLSHSISHVVDVDVPLEIGAQMLEGDAAGGEP